MPRCAVHVRACAQGGHSEAPGQPPPSHTGGGREGRGPGREFLVTHTSIYGQPRRGLQADLSSLPAGSKAELTKSDPWARVLGESSWESGIPSRRKLPEGCFIPANMVIEVVVPLDSSGLARLLRDPQESGRTLVLDCRPFLAYCQAHLLDARPVHWNGLLRRRSRGRSGVSLEWLVPDRALLTRLRKGEMAHLVVLDETGGSVSALRPDSLARLLLNALLREERAGTSHIYLLEGKKRNTQTHTETHTEARAHTQGLGEEAGRKDGVRTQLGR